MIFIRHFFCGVCVPSSFPAEDPQIKSLTAHPQNCQEYIRTLTTSHIHQRTPPPHNPNIHNGNRLRLSRFDLHVRGRDNPVHTPFYADPTKRLYSALGMQRTLNLGSRPEYQRRGTLKGMLQSVRQGVSALGKGRALKGGDMASGWGGILV